MTRIEDLLELTYARALFYSACCHGDFVETDWAELRPAFQERYQALMELASEIKAALPLGSKSTPTRAASGRRTLWIVSKQMDGGMTASVFAEQEAALAEKDRFKLTFHLEDDHDAHASCDVKEIRLDPPQRISDDGVDLRYALIMLNWGSIGSAIYETEEELDADLEEWKELVDYGDDDSSAMYGRHPILIPSEA